MSRGKFIRNSESRKIQRPLERFLNTTDHVIDCSQKQEGKEAKDIFSVWCLKTHFINKVRAWLVLQKFEIFDTEIIHVGPYFSSVVFYIRKVA